MMKCVFFDRDGIVNKSPGPGYVERWEDFHLLPEFVDALRLVLDKGCKAVVITNQRGVARGMMSIETLDEMHSNLVALLRDKYGLELLDILVCPHERDSCDCRKPKPGMLLEAAEKHGIDLSVSWMIGDHETDVEAGRSAGCRTVRVCPDAEDTAADFHIADMTTLKALLEKEL